MRSWKSTGAEAVEYSEAVESCDLTDIPRFSATSRVWTPAVDVATSGGGVGAVTGGLEVGGGRRWGGS